MKRIVLISCVSRKGKKKAKAKDLYKGPLFTNSLAYAHKLNPDKIYILSALHHLVDLEQEIEPYDVTLSYIPPSKRKEGLIVLSNQEKENWGKEVLKQLEQVSDLQNDEFIILAGESYISPLKKGIKNMKKPLSGLRQGERVQYLTNNL